MTRTHLRSIIGTATLALGLLAAGAVEPASAQTTPSGAQGGSSTAPENDDDGTDLGWIGLLGLAGLLGLRRRDAVRVDRVERVETTASTRPRV